MTIRFNMWAHRAMLAIACLLANTALFAAKPDMPHDLEEIVTEGFMHLEEAYRGQEWRDAYENTVEIEEGFRAVMPELQGKIVDEEGKKLLDQFKFQVNSLKNALAKQDVEKAEHAFKFLEALIVELIELFSYDKHPVLALFDHELEEFAEEPEFDEIAGETTEMGSFMKRIEPTLNKRGVDQALVADFYAKLDALAAAVNGRDEEKVRAAIDALRESNSKLLNLVKSD